MPPKNPPANLFTEATEISLTAEQAAVLVGIDAGDVFAFRDYGDRVVVVTVSGHKLEADKA